MVNNNADKKSNKEFVCDFDVTDESLFKRIMLTTIGGLVLSAGTGWLLAWALGARLDPAAWTIFINAKLPLIWTQTTTALLAIYMTDFVTPGRSIAKILWLEGECDTSENRRTACLFLLGVGAIAAYTVKGGLVD